MNRVYLHHDVVVDGKRYEVHLGRRADGKLVVYRRTPSGLRSVSSMIAERVLREWFGQQQRSLETANQSREATQNREPVVVTNERWWQTLRRRLAAWWRERRDTAE